MNAGRPPICRCSGKISGVLGQQFGRKYSRPGPRVVDGIEMLAEIFDPEAFRDLSPATGWTPIP